MKKYQHILNNQVLFETDDVSEFFSYLMKENNSQAKNSTLYNLLEKSDGYVCNMMTVCSN